MAPTVDGYRNAIRVAVGRYERDVSSGFTKEALAAICEALGDPVEGPPYPPKGEMRARARARFSDAASVETASTDPFRKADLAALAETVDAAV